MSAGRLSEIMFSKVLSLSLHDPLAPVPLVQEGVKAKGLLPPHIFMRGQPPCTALREDLRTNLAGLTWSGCDLLALDFN